MIPLNSCLINNRIQKEHKETLVVSIYDKEVIDALHQFNDDKSPGVNGFMAKFFEHNLDLISKQFLVASHHVFNTKKLPQMFKHTLIPLISKSKHASNIVDLCPISLCLRSTKL